MRRHDFAGAALAAAALVAFLGGPAFERARRRLEYQKTGANPVLPVSEVDSFPHHAGP
jgi:hypothetical protein